MDGWTALWQLRETIGEGSSSDYLNDQLSYTLLFEAAKELNRRTASIVSSQTITIVAEQAEYNLNPDFGGLYLKTTDGEPFVKYNDGTNDTFITMKPYAEVIYDNQTESVTIPDFFSIRHATTQVSNVTGTATADGTVSNGEATLTDTASSTRFANVSSGDAVHNTTGSEHGIVISKTSNTALVTAIFDSNGDAQSWSSGDAYVIVPQPRMSIVFDPPPSTSSHTVTIEYIKNPEPVFSPYRSYTFPYENGELIRYAAGMYKMRDKDATFAAAFTQQADRGVKLTGGTVRKVTDRNTWTMNLKKRRW
ncbi:MAG: hypothetical protein PHY29_03090 [Syntrophales bacterium]|nr:hypothetical protein [Syntrophales bacterium]